MQSKALNSHRPFRMVSPLMAAAYPRRVELVVTDTDGPAGLDGKDGSGIHHETRCTIPLAFVEEDFPVELLQEMARFNRPWTAAPISAGELMQLLTQLFGALDHQAWSVGQGLETGDADLARVRRLTPRERQVLQHVVAGDPNKRTALLLNISRRTVEHHRASIMQKTRTKSVSELVRLALRTGLFASADHAHA